MFKKLKLKKFLIIIIIIIIFFKKIKSNQIELTKFNNKDIKLVNAKLIITKCIKYYYSLKIKVNNSLIYI